MKIDVYVTEDGITTLGPHRRFGLWVQGCNRDCKGCIAKRSHDPDKGEWMEVGLLAWRIISSDSEGITVSGGEPFLQSEALCALIQQIKEKRDIGVIIYTGYRVEELSEVPFADKLLGMTDLLIDGPYVEELDDGKNLRGSSNQRVILLTDRYAEYASLYGTGPRKTEIFYHENGFHMVGLPNLALPKRNLEEEEQHKKGINHE